MSFYRNQLFKLADAEGDGVRHVFLVEHAGADFTFYVRDDAETEEKKLCQILTQASEPVGRTKPQVAGRGENGGEGEAAPQLGLGALAALRHESSFACRINVLCPLLNKDDFIRRGKKIVLLRGLLEAKNGKVRKRPYVALFANLTQTTRAALSVGRLEDKRLLEKVVKELNRLLALGLDREPFNKPLTGNDSDLVAQIKGDPATQAKLSNYLRFCSLFDDAIRPIGSRIMVGRVLAGLSYEGDFWSITFRKQETGTGYAPAEKLIPGALNSIKELCSTLYEEVFFAVSKSEGNCDESEDASGRCSPVAEVRRGKATRGQSNRDKLDKHKGAKLPEMGGLVVVAGSTNSAKSLITRGLIHLYLENVLLSEGDRRPHLVTFEDPIEKYFAEMGGAGDVQAAEDLIDYTPRQRGIDAPDLQGALHDALRQTPKIFFVGETRRNEDWRALIDFAATGHLVVTTAHAGSLIEAMHKILLATEAKTPAERNEVASRILAVVQLKRAEVPGFANCKALVPAVWRRVPQGVNSLTAEGLASILPHSHSDENRPCSCLGRKYFAERLLKMARTRAQDPFNSPRLSAALTKKAIDWDLQGA